MTGEFTNPFRYVPHPLVKKAAGQVIGHIDRLIASGELPEDICRGFSEGKMLGVLICRGECGDAVFRNEDGLCCLAAFSGSVGGRSRLDGFVPPIYDLLDPTGHFKEKEAEISAVTRQITEKQRDLLSVYAPLEQAIKDRDMALETMRKRQMDKRTARHEMRKTWEVNGAETAMTERSLIAESQHDKAEYRREKERWKEKIMPLETKVREAEDHIKCLKARRSGMSEELQKWIFSQYEVTNRSGERRTVWDIFAEKGLTPPGGTGDCAAPKLLEHAFRNGLTPVAMGEFWYGASPDTAVRTHGHFYPSCTSKCSPLLTFMLSGMDIYDDEPSTAAYPQVIYDDLDVIVAEKPSGMPSVPGLDGRQSMQETLSGRYGEIHAVHRLDMDTSGLILFARNGGTAAALRKQFEERRVSKTYRALLTYVPGRELTEGTCGSIGLPLSPDYDERPRQKVDFDQGKPAVTEYEVVRTNPDGTSEVLFHPVTGRTHQLRVHSAHHLGLGRPIEGDLLYGSHTVIPSAGSTSRLRLHAQEITFTHPATGETMTFRSRQEF